MSRPLIDRSAAALLRALKPELGPYRLVEVESAAWASATFVGGRHRIMVELDGDDGPARAGALPARIENAEFALPGLLVADIVARADGAILTIEALILDEC